MERYSGTQAMEGFPADPALEWEAHGGETGLEESMWQLGLGGGPQSYPENLNEPDCIYYLKTGFCGFGDRCRFNHPRDRSAATRDLRAGEEIEYPERDGQPVCQYYVRTGICKFGSSCKYHHPRHGIGSTAPVALNYYGYPLRPGEKECLYYIKTGQCKFGVTCKFHHPQPTEIQQPAPPPSPGSFSAPTTFPAPAVYPTHPSQSVQSSHQYDLIPSKWPVARPAMLPGSCVPGSYGPMLYPTGVVPFPSWTPYPAPVNPVHSQSTQPTAGVGPIYGIPQLSPAAAAYTGTYITSSAAPLSSTQKIFPQRPGQPECQYYLRNGDCKFGPTCKYHHPPDWSAPWTNFLFSPMGLPLRPGAPLCSHYAQDGICRFGPSCKFDHPMKSLSYSPSASSLTDIPVAPYPVRYTNATLAPSSSSSNLRPEFLSGSTKDPFSPQMSSMNSSSGSVGSLFSKNETVPQSRANQSALDSTS